MNSWRLQNSTGRVLFKAHLTGTDTPATGKTIAVTLSKNGAAFGNPNAGASNATEIGSGWYYFAPAAEDRDTLGPVVWRGTEGTIDPAETEELVVDAVRLGLTALPNAAAGAVGGIPLPIWSGTLDAVTDSTVEFPTGYGVSIEAQILVEITEPGAHFGKSRYASYSGAGDVWTVDKAWNADGETTPTGTPTARAFSVPANPSTNLPPVDVVNWKGSTAPAMTGDAFARLGAPAGASIAADLLVIDNLVDDLETRLTAARAGYLDNLSAGAVAQASALATVAGYLDTEIAAILVIAQRLDTALELDGAVYRFTVNALEQAPTGGSAPTVTQIRQEIDANSTQLAAILALLDTEIAAIQAAVAAVPTAAQNADVLLGRNIAGGSSTGRTVTSALRRLRNRVAIAAGTMTVYQEDDTTSDHTAAVTTASGNPISEINPT